ncbi:hypothetical protein GCM10009815_13000 [Nocardioides marmoribigeumensis]
MMKKTALLAAGTVAALTAASITLASPGQADSSTSSAFGISAEGPVPIEPMPAISSSDGTLKQSSAGSLPDNPLASATISALYAGNRKAGITLVDASVGGGLLEQLPPPPQELVDACQQATDQVPDLPTLPEVPGLPIPTPTTPAQLSDVCKVLLTPPDSLLGAKVIEVSCQGTKGDVRVAGLKLLGQAVDVPSTAPNTSIPADPLLNVTINKQTKNADGSFSVQGLVVSLGDGTEVLTLGSATCGTAAAGRAPAQAPAPKPVTRSLPVTG